jgi:hypothetical protein
VKNFLIDLAISFLSRNGYITRSIVSDYLEFIRIHNNALTFNRNHKLIKYDDLYAEVRSLRMGTDDMSPENQTRIITEWEKKQLEMK